MMNEKEVYIFQEDGKYSLTMCYGDVVRYYKTTLDDEHIRTLCPDSIPLWQPRYDVDVKIAKIKTLRKFVSVPKKDFRSSDVFTEKQLEEHLSKSFPFSKVVGVRGHEYPDYGDIYELEFNYAIDDSNPISTVVNHLEERSRECESWQRSYEDMKKEHKKKCEHHWATKLELDATGKAYEELSWVFDNPSFMVIMKLTKTWLCNLFKFKK